ncbi:inosine triphosphate pyrophosphatase-like protein [Baffinella frigidus]|nr:inosine triphosphate pyrophosphatase-like protein [Cryptophyta sp. CCMP2293]
MGGMEPKGWGEAREVPMREAMSKAKALASKLRGTKAVVVTTGNVVVNKRGRVLGKPGTVEEAQKMLADLSGSRVTVMSAMVVTNTLTGHCEQDTHCTTLAFDTLPLELIEALAHTEAARTSPGALCIMDERLGRYIDYSGLSEGV